MIIPDAVMNRSRLGRLHLIFALLMLGLAVTFWRKGAPPGASFVAPIAVTPPTSPPVEFAPPTGPAEGLESPRQAENPPVLVPPGKEAVVVKCTCGAANTGEIRDTEFQLLCAGMRHDNDVVRALRPLLARYRKQFLDEFGGWTPVDEYRCARLAAQVLPMLDRLQSEFTIDAGLVLPAEQHERLQRLLTSMYLFGSTYYYEIQGYPKSLKNAAHPDGPCDLERRFQERRSGADRARGRSE